ncbi:MAG: glutaredoxin domain-containing protein [Candidatus Roizmanbacteria bacterium]
MNVTLYTIADCQFCAAAKEYLKSKNISFVEKDVEANPADLEEMQKASGNFPGVPFTQVKKDDGSEEGLKGFTKEQFDAIFDSPVANSSVAPSITPSETPMPIAIAEVPVVSPVMPEPVSESPIPPVDTTSTIPMSADPISSGMPASSMANPLYQSDATNKVDQPMAPSPLDVTNLSSTSMPAQAQDMMMSETPTPVVEPSTAQEMPTSIDTTTVAGVTPDMSVSSEVKPQSDQTSLDDTLSKLQQQLDQAPAVSTPQATPMTPAVPDFPSADPAQAVAPAGVGIDTGNPVKPSL